MMLSERYTPVFSPDEASGGGGTGSTTSPPPSSAAHDAGPSGSGASPAPTAPSGGSQSPDGPTGTPSGEAFDFSSIFEGGVNELGAADAAPKAPAQPMTAPAPEPGVPPEATAPPAASVATPAPGAAQPEPAPTAAPGTTAPPSQPTAAMIDPYDPGVLSQHLAQNEAQAIQFVSDGLFKLSPEETEALEQDVIGTVPKLLAKVFVKSQQNVLAQMGRMIPVMVQRHLEAVKRNTDNEEKFYSRWPDIARDKYHESVAKYAAVYRQMHPQATLEQMIEDLGPMIMMANKIVPQVRAQGATAGQPARLAAPGAANGRSPQPSPFVPAGSGPVAQPQRVEQTPWEAMFNQQE